MIITVFISFVYIMRQMPASRGSIGRPSSSRIVNSAGSRVGESALAS